MRLFVCLCVILPVFGEEFDVIMTLSIWSFIYLAHVYLYEWFCVIASSDVMPLLCYISMRIVAFFSDAVIFLFIQLIMSHFMTLYLF